MAMDAQRALLDQLMGQERNLQAEERKGLKRHFSDPDIDKYYLSGCSPYELFKNTKSDLGDNPKVINEACKHEWDALSQEEKDKYGYEYETWQFLESLIGEVDRKIWKNKQRIGETDAAAYREDAQKILDIDDSIREMLRHVQQYANQGDVERAMQLQTQVYVNYKMRSDTLKVPEQQKKMLVCPVSGNLISSADNDERLRCHFEGKQYKGWKKIRAFLKKYRENPPPREGMARDNRNGNPRTKSLDGERRPSNDSRGRRRSWSRDRSRYRDRPKSRDRRDRDRYHDRDRGWRDRRRDRSSRRSRSRSFGRSGRDRRRY